MNIMCSLKRGCTSSSVIMGLYVLQVISVSALGVDSSPHGSIAFASAPDKVLDGSPVVLRYHCSGPCQLGVRVLATTLQETDLVIFKRKWLIGAPQGNRTHRVPLRFPSSVLHRPSLHNREVLEAVNVTLQAWIHHKDMHLGILTASKQLQIAPLWARPIKPPTECPSWPSKLMWQINTSRPARCRRETAEIDLLEFPFASTGEVFGVVRRVRPLMDGGLERLRRRAVSNPRAAVSVWIYLTRWCQETRCAIFHHLCRGRMYGSPLIQLSDAGNVVFQAQLTNGEDEAFRINQALPLWTWIRLDGFMQDATVHLTITWDGHISESVHKFQQNIYLDDTDGYFIIGGSRYMKGIHGYFGPVKYQRFATKKVKNDLSPKDLFTGLSDFHSQCEALKNITNTYQQEVTASHFLSPINKDDCTPSFVKTWGQFSRKSCAQTWSWESQKQHNVFFNFLRTREKLILKAGNLSFTSLRRALLEEGVEAMFTGGQVEIKMTEKSRALLHTAACFGNHRASLLLAALHLSGLGHTVDRQKGLIYSLIGALGDNRFALMHAGYKHTQGIDGFVKDFDMAYGYYSNVGHQSINDMGKMHQSKQYTSERIYLWNNEELAQREIASTDMVDFLRYQAERGDVESQKYLGSMLYWGQNGVSKDMASGIRWLERSALQMKDPEAMYDYSILLMKGQGVKRNYTRAVDLLKKAAEMGSINALNGLGWYHGIILNDHKSAVKYFEQAAFNGSDDGMFNLGIYHLSGTVPDLLQQNETAAFLHFLNASESEHAGGSVEAAHYLSTGDLRGVSQDAERAVRYELFISFGEESLVLDCGAVARSLWHLISMTVANSRMLKKVCERNGHLGFMIREALQFYLQGSWHEAFVKYVLAAETGLGLAQSNAAHLCEELRLGDDCLWRYQNHSILNYDPHPVALLKMADFLLDSWSVRQDSLSELVRVMRLYSRAALSGSPQGMFNLFILVQRGHSLPWSAQDFFNVSHHDELDSVMEKILTRCVEATGVEGEEAVAPCALALLSVQMWRALRSMSQSAPLQVLVCAAFLSLCVIIVTAPLRMCLEQRRRGGGVVAQRAQTSSGSQDGISINSEQNGIMGDASYIPAGSLRISVQTGEHWLSWTGDLALTLGGVCLCAFWTALLYHLV